MTPEEFSQRLEQRMDDEANKMIQRLRLTPMEESWVREMMRVTQATANVIEERFEAEIAAGNRMRPVVISGVFAATLAAMQTMTTVMEKADNLRKKKESELVSGQFIG